MSKVISMPERKMSRAREFQSADAKKAFLSLSLMSLIVMAVMVTDRWTQGQRPIYIVSDKPNQLNQLGQLNRAIASAQPQYMFRDVEWEHQLATKLAIENLRSPAAVAQPKSSLDHLRYEVLAGKYRLSQEQSKIKELEYVDSMDNGDHPQDLVREQFLKEFKDLFVVSYDQSKLETKDGNHETHQLFNQKGQAVGRAAFELDDRGHVLSLKFENSDK